MRPSQEVAARHRNDDDSINIEEATLEMMEKVTEANASIDLSMGIAIVLDAMERTVIWLGDFIVRVGLEVEALPEGYETELRNVQKAHTYHRAAAMYDAVFSGEVDLSFGEQTDEGDPQPEADGQMTIDEGIANAEEEAEGA